MKRNWNPVPPTFDPASDDENRHLRPAPPDDAHGEAYDGTCRHDADDYGQDAPVDDPPWQEPAAPRVDPRLDASQYPSFGEDDGDDYENDHEDDVAEEDAAPSRRRILVPAIGFALGVALFGGVVWYAYDSAPVAEASGEAPLILADDEPIKRRPDQPGGIDVPHQDKLIFDRLSPGASEPPVEQLLPPPEEPMKRPTPPPPEASPTAPPGLPQAPDVAPPPTTIAGDAPPPTLDGQTQDAAIAEAGAPLPPEPPLAKRGATRAPAAPPPTVSPAVGAYRVQFAALRDETQAQAEFARLQARHAELAGLGLRVDRADLGDKGVFYRLQAGPLDETRARAICKALVARDAPCLVVKE